MLKTDKPTALLDCKLPLWGDIKTMSTIKRIYKMLYNAKNVNGRISVVDRWEFTLNSFQLCCMFENDHSEKLEKQVKGFKELYAFVISWIGWLSEAFMRS